MRRWDRPHRVRAPLEMQRVRSSNVHSALYDFEERGMYVRFIRSGPDDLYVYPNTSARLWQSFMQSDSKGAWIWDNMIRENRPYELLSTRDWHLAFDKAEFPRDAREVLFP